MEATHEQKRNRLLIVLCAIFITNALIAEIIGTKIFSAEATAGLEPANLGILGFTMNFDLTAGVLIWPVVFITTDLINEYFGKPGVKKISYLTVVLIAYAFLVIYLTIELPGAGWWREIKEKDGSTFNMDLAFSRVMGQSQRIIIGSLTAFLVAQLVDVFVFHRLRRATSGRYLWLRATGSTLVSQLVDSYVVLFIAFYGVFPTDRIIAIGITNYIYKFAVAIILTPVIYLGHSLIDNYLGADYARKMMDRAAADSRSAI